MRPLEEAALHDPLHVAILGSRGVPSRVGGFETLAERLSLHLAGQGWRVTVSCEEPGRGPVREEGWRGVRLLRVPMVLPGTAGAFAYDCRATARLLPLRPDVVLNLGYNTGFLNLVYRRRGIPSVVNMDGLEWRREKWSIPVKLWLRLNERLAVRWGDRLVADHPVIATRLAELADPARVATIPYGADPPPPGGAPAAPGFGLEPGRFVLLVARLEPENSALEVVQAFSLRRRGVVLAVVGPFEPGRNGFHRRLRGAAGGEVRFLGGVTDRDALARLRAEARLSVHGHRVGGTNPSLVEALAAGSPVLAHDNPFNRWVAGEAAAYFADRERCAAALDELLDDPPRLGRMVAASRARHAEAFRWEPQLEAYEELLASAACRRTPAGLRERP